MGIESDKEAKIRKYIKENGECKTKRVLQIEYRGQLLDLPIFKIPIELLTYNLENGRFAADKLNEESQLGRCLDADNEDDIKVIKRLLLEKDQSETKRLKEDFKDIGQREAGLITIAGNVINANRRMAILFELLAETGKEKYKFLEVAILPKGTDEKEIWGIESRLQFARDFRVDYGPVNELLKIKDAVKKGINKKEIAEILYLKPEEVDERIERLDLINTYLDYINKSGQYIHIQDKRINEHFIDALNNLKGSRDSFEDLKDWEKFRELHFELIDSGVNHRNVIRPLKFIPKNIETKNKSFSILEKKKNGEISPVALRTEIEDIIDLVKEKNKQKTPVQLLQRAHELLVKVDELEGELNNQAKAVLIKIDGLIKSLAGE